MTTLEITNLRVSYETNDGPLTAVDDVSLDIYENEILGIVGESGCGKTTLSKAILGLLAKNGSVTNGEIRYDGDDITAYSNTEMNAIRWSDIAYIIQNAMNALDPVYRVGSQFSEVIRNKEDISKQAARERTQLLLERVGIDKRRIRDYPHEFSGGQRQRLVIALSLALEPELIIADEPTTGLDVIVKDDILDLLADVQAELQNTIIIITHDMSVISEIADRVGVMYGGELVELGTTTDVFLESAHPYTMGLVNAFPSVTEPDAEMVSIPGSPPDLRSPPDGCRFTARCPFSTEDCERRAPDSHQISDGHTARCHYPEDAAAFREAAADHERWLTEVEPADD